jgi:hypothetical protein
MEIPEPIPGLVIRYSYLWNSEYKAGRIEAGKDRPACIVVAVHEDDGTPRVLLLPVTHVEPSDAARGIEIPPRIKRRLGLDGDRSWIIVDDANEFFCPGFDLRPVPGDPNRNVAYGQLPPIFFRQVRDRFIAAIRAGQITRVPRTD